MGDFRIEINLVGGHGCQRDKRDGEVITACSDPACPDCMIGTFVDELRKKMSLRSAVLTHWPGQRDSVVDVFDTSTPINESIKRRRRGSF